MPKQDDANANADAGTSTQSAPNAPTHHLIVIHPFASFKKGDLITDSDTITEVLAGENARQCNRVYPK